MSFFYRARLTQATDESSANLVSDIAGYSPSTIRRNQNLGKISSKGTMSMNDTNAADVTRISRPGKNPSVDNGAVAPRIVSEPIPLIGSGLKIKLSDYTEYEQCLAHTLVRERMYSSLMGQAKQAYTPAKRANFTLSIPVTWITVLERALWFASGSVWSWLLSQLI